MLKHNLPQHYACLNLKHLTENACDAEVARCLF